MPHARLSKSALQELASFLAIPSVSADAARAAAVTEAAEWVAAFIRRTGGNAEILNWQGSRLVDGTIPASRDASSAATILCYGHFDVQPPEPIGAWHSDPFSSTLRDGWLHARGVADDK